MKCQPISARITPSSTTRLVEAISNPIAAVRFAPLRNSERASATTAYEQDDEAAASGGATAATWLRVLFNYLVPFCVSSAGFFSCRRAA